MKVFCSWGPKDSYTALMPLVEINFVTGLREKEKEKQSREDHHTTSCHSHTSCHVPSASGGHRCAPGDALRRVFEGLLLGHALLHVAPEERLDDTVHAAQQDAALAVDVGAVPWGPKESAPSGSGSSLRRAGGEGGLARTSLSTRKGAGGGAHSEVMVVANTNGEPTATACGQAPR